MPGEEIKTLGFKINAKMESAAVTSKMFCSISLT